MTTDVSTDIKRGVNGSPWIGILPIVLGIVAIAQPAVSTIFKETWFTLILISAGCQADLRVSNPQPKASSVLLLSVLYIGTA